MASKACLFLHPRNKLYLLRWSAWFAMLICAAISPVPAAAAYSNSTICSRMPACSPAHCGSRLRISANQLAAFAEHRLIVEAAPVLCGLDDEPR